MAHLSDDETVAKMGHPGLWHELDVGHPPRSHSKQRPTHDLTALSNNEDDFKLPGLILRQPVCPDYLYSSRVY
jgi:hypothetical protein